MKGRNFIRDLSVKNKMTLVILSVAFTVITVGFVFISLWDINRLKKEIRSELSLNTRLIGDYCIVPLVFGDKSQASEALSRLRLIKSVVGANLFNEAGNIFSTYPDSSEINLKDHSWTTEKVEFTDGFFYLSEPVIFENKTIGTIVIKADSVEMKELSRNLGLILLSVFVTMLLFSFLLASRLRKLITNPILKLAEFTSSISQNHDFDQRLESYGKDEVGELYQQFNNLLQQLSIKEKERDKAVKETTFLAHVLKNINENVSITDINDKIIFVNQSFLRTYGYTGEELINRDISIIRSPNNPAEVVYKILPETLRGGWDGELLNRKKDGTDFPIQLSTTVINDEQNNPSALVGICTDITERKKVENELTQHRNNLERLVAERTKKLNAVMEETRDLYENAPCGYHSVNSEGMFVRMNNTEMEWLGYKRDEIINRLGFKNIIHPKETNKYEEYFAKLKEEGAVSDVEFEFIRKDGSSFFGSINATAIFDSKGKFIMSRSTLFDITARKEAEKALSVAIEKAEAANLAKSEFLANMSHEIRTPMNAVLGYTELLSSMLTDQLQKNYIESIKSSGRSLLTLINDILDLSKIEAGKLELEYDYVDSVCFFNEFERIFALKAFEKGIQFIVQVESGTPAGIYIDEPRLRQIVFNLVGNAMKFTNHGYVKLRVFTENLQTIKYNEGKEEEFLDLIIEVEDTGIGISKELREEIFDPFIQARDQKNIGGTGLGLAITRRLTLLMNGTISLKSEVGKGSTFSVLIPEVAFKRDFVSDKTLVNLNPDNIVFEPSVILVVDDVEHNRTFIRDILKDKKIKVYDADEGFKALEIMKKVVPDLIITDIKMPNMDGFELLDRIKKNPVLKDIPVFAYSASVLKDQKDRIHKSLFAGLLTKPLNITDMYIALMNHLKFNEIRHTEEIKKNNDESDINVINKEELINKLETTFREIWRTFEKRQPIGEIQMFGEKLSELGESHNSESVLNYGRDLINAADTFNIEAILMLLKQYEMKINDLKSRLD